MKFEVGETQLSVSPLAMNIDDKICILTVSTPQVQLKKLGGVVKGSTLTICMLINLLPVSSKTFYTNYKIFKVLCFFFILIKSY